MTCTSFVHLILLSLIIIILKVARGDARDEVANRPNTLVVLLSFELISGYIFQDDLMSEFSIMAFSEQNVSYGKEHIERISHLIDLDQSVDLSRTMAEAASFVHPGRFDTVYVFLELDMLLNSKFKWSYFDFMRWIRPGVKIVLDMTESVIPRHPPIDDRVLLRQMGKISDQIMVRTHDDKLILAHSYYIDPRKVHAASGFHSSADQSGHQAQQCGAWLQGNISTAEHEKFVYSQDFSQLLLLVRKRHPYFVPFLDTQESLVINILSDVDIQVNGVVLGDLKLLAVGIRLPQGWIYAHAKYGLDFEIKPEYAAGFEDDFMNHASAFGQLNINIDQGSATVISLNLKTTLHIDQQTGSVSVVFSAANRFSSPMGLLGKYWHATNTTGLDWLGAVIKDGYLFSIDSCDQSYFSHGIYGNIYEVPEAHDVLRYNIEKYPKYTAGHLMSGNVFKAADLDAQRYTKSPTAPIQHVVYFQMEGSFFDYQGFTTVNAHLWLQLYCLSKDILVKIVATDLMTRCSNVKPHSLLVILMYQAFRIPWMTPTLESLTCEFSDSWLDRLSKSVRQCFDPFYFEAIFKEKVVPSIIFRNGWIGRDANFRLPADQSTMLVHLLPWEFHALPKRWVRPLDEFHDEIWLPSSYCKHSFMANQITPDHIHVIPHGVAYSKFRQIKKPYMIPTQKSCRILFSGGNIKRKGIDVALRAYKKTFRFSDDVVLVIHSIYESHIQPEIDAYMADYKAVRKDPSLIVKNPEKYDIPEILFISDYLSYYEKVTLYHACSVFLSPYRSEGFGLMILEAMASGLPVIVPMHGPAIEFTTSESAFYIKSSPLVSCYDKPCGKLSILAKPTMFQPQWNEPDIESLSDILLQIYRDLPMLSEKSKGAIRDAARLDWRFIGSATIERIQALSSRTLPRRYHIQSA